MAKQNSEARTSTFSVKLESFPPDRKVEVVAALRDVLPGILISTARDILDNHMPELLVERASEQRKDEIVNRFAEVGAQCKVEEWVSIEPLKSAAALLRVVVSAFGEAGTEPVHGPADMDDVTDSIGLALDKVDHWLSLISCEDGTHAFRALDLLLISHSAIDTKFTSLRTINPLRTALTLAAEELELAIRDNSPQEETVADSDVQEAA